MALVHLQDNTLSFRSDPTPYHRGESHARIVVSQWSSHSFKVIPTGSAYSEPDGTNERATLEVSYLDSTRNRSR